MKTKLFRSKIRPGKEVVGSMRRTFEIGGKAVFVFHSNRPGSPVIYLNTYSDEGQKVYEAAQATGWPPFTLVTVSNLAWNHDMAPWDSPAAFKKGGTLYRRGGQLPAAAGGGDHTQGRKRAG